MWLNWQKGNRVLIVFIHGIFGSRWSTWKILFDRLQEDIIQCQIHPPPGADLNGFNVYSWEYRTKLLAQPFLLPDVVGEFGGWLEAINAGGSYKSIVLVCHSQGGVIAKSFVLEKLRKAEGTSLRTDVIITIGTPHRGPRFYINFLFSAIFLLKKIPIVKAIIPFNQCSQLASISDVLKNLKVCWNPEKVSTVPLPKALPARKHVRSFSISKKRDMFVSRRSARGFHCDIQVDLGSLAPLLGEDELRPMGQLNERRLSRGHAIKLQDLLVLEHLIESHLPVSDVLRRIRRIKGSSEEYREYLDACMPLVADIVYALHPDFDANRLEIKTAEILSDFLDLFPGNPFRGFPWPEVISEFTRQRLGVFNGQ